MTAALIMLLLAGGLTLAGIAYPTYARQQFGWKTGAWVGGTVWSLWFGLGAINTLAAAAGDFGWLGALLVIPAAFVIGFVVVLAVKSRTQLIAPIGPALAIFSFVSTF